MSNCRITDKLFLFETKREKRNKRRTKKKKKKEKTKKKKKKKKKKAADLEELNTGWRKNMGRSQQGFVGRQRGFVA